MSKGVSPPSHHHRPKTHVPVLIEYFNRTEVTGANVVIHPRPVSPLLLGLVRDRQHARVSKWLWQTIDTEAHLIHSHTCV